MNAMKRGKSGNESIYVPTSHGGLVQRSTGTAVKNLVRGMKRMVGDLKDRSTASGDWSVLDAIFANRVTLRETYVFYTSGRIAELEARMSAKNLSASLDGWIAWVRASRDAEAGTADVYWQQVTTLIPPGEVFYGSDLTKERVMSWLSSRTEASPGTRRKYFYALKSFVRYLLDTNVYATDPLAGMKAPKKNKARRRWVTEETDRALVGAAIAQYRAAFAFIKATGCDVGSARRAQIGDVDLNARTADIRGTKTDRRAVHRAAIEPWAIPILAEHMASRIGRHTPLFDRFTNSGASHHHASCCTAVGVEDYTLKDSRHSVGVRMRLAGKSFEEIAAQLGTSVYQVVNVYAQYTPEQAKAVVAK